MTTPERSLRSEGKHLLTTPRYRRLEGFGKRCFAHATPSLWNTLPISIKCAQSIDTFKSNLKTHLLNGAYSYCDVTFVSYCVYFPNFCRMSVWYHKRFWAWRRVVVEMDAIENWIIIIVIVIVIAIIAIVNVIKSPQSGMTLCFQFVSTASAAASSAAATAFASHVKTVWAKP